MLRLCWTYDYSAGPARQDFEGQLLSAFPTRPAQLYMITVQDYLSFKVRVFALPHLNTCSSPPACLTAHLLLCVHVALVSLAHNWTLSGMKSTHFNMYQGYCDNLTLFSNTKWCFGVTCKGPSVLLVTSVSMTQLRRML